MHTCERYKVYSRAYQATSTAFHVVTEYRCPVCGREWSESTVERIGDRDPAMATLAVLCIVLGSLVFLIVLTL